MIIDNIGKMLKVIIPHYKRQKTIRHYVGGKSHLHIKYEDGTEFVCIPSQAIKNYNIQISKLWIDKEIDSDTIKKQILPKYIGKQEDIIWI